MLLSGMMAQAQEISRDSLIAADRRNASAEINSKLAVDEAELVKLKKELSEAKAHADEATRQARESARANRQTAEKLAANPKDKSLSDNATKLARAAQKDARSARKAAESYAKLEKEVAGLQTKIDDTRAKLVTYPRPMSVEVAAQPAPVVFAEPVAAQEARQERREPAAMAADSGKREGSLHHILDKVVEQTYKSYPQQPGQPAIIINNIVVPPDYNRGVQATSGGQARYALSEADLREFEAFKLWRESSAGRAGVASGGAAAPAGTPAQMTPAPASPQADIQPSPQKLTFAQRFGEVKTRRSGMWVIPMVGIHASNFEADFSDDEAKGRSGWNAGLDFRAHQKRFFIQPGVHYFSSSMDVTSKDSLSNAPLLKGPRIHSLKVPLLLGIYLTKERGTFLKLNLKGGVTGTYVMSVDKNSQTRFTKDNIEEFSYGLNAGLGIELGLLTIDLSHEWGMSELFKDDKSKSNVLRATLGIKL